MQDAVGRQDNSATVKLSQSHQTDARLEIRRKKGTQNSLAIRRWDMNKHFCHILLWHSLAELRALVSALSRRQARRAWCAAR